MNEIKIIDNPQEKWNKICNITKDIGKEVLGTKTTNKRHNDNILEELAKNKHKLKNDIESTTNEEIRKMKKEEKKQIKKQMDDRIQHLEEAELEAKLKNLENIKNDSNKYYSAMKEIKSMRNNAKICVKNEEGLIVTNEEEQVKTVAEYFQKILGPDSAKENIIDFPPKMMNQPFTGEEIMKAAKKLKNGKSPGPDNLELELIKYAPIEIHQEIAKIFNSVAETGEKVTELMLGILRPLQKPGKSKGPPENLIDLLCYSQYSEN